MRESVKPTINCGVGRAVGNGLAMLRASASHSAVSVRLIDAGSFITTSTSTRSYRSPSAARRWASTSAAVSPGRVRTSTPMSTTSGMTLVLNGWPPVCSELQENVVWVQACRCAPGPGTGRASRKASIRSVSSRSRWASSGMPSVSTRVRHSSWKRGAGR